MGGEGRDGGGCGGGCREYGAGICCCFVFLLLFSHDCDWGVAMVGVEYVVTVVSLLLLLSDHQEEVHRMVMAAAAVAMMAGSVVVFVMARFEYVTVAFFSFVVVS